MATAGLGGKRPAANGRGGAGGRRWARWSVAVGGGRGEGDGEEGEGGCFDGVRGGGERNRAADGLEDATAAGLGGVGGRLGCGGPRRGEEAGAEVEAATVAVFAFPAGADDELTGFGAGHQADGFSQEGLFGRRQAGPPGAVVWRQIRVVHFHGASLARGDGHWRSTGHEGIGTASRGPAVELTGGRGWSCRACDSGPRVRRPRLGLKACQP